MTHYFNKIAKLFHAHKSTKQQQLQYQSSKQQNSFYLLTNYHHWLNVSKIIMSSQRLSESDDDVDIHICFVLF